MTVHFTLSRDEAPLPFSDPDVRITVLPWLGPSCVTIIDLVSRVGDLAWSDLSAMTGLGRNRLPMVTNRLVAFRVARQTGDGYVLDSGLTVDRWEHITNRLMDTQPEPWYRARLRAEDAMLTRRGFPMEQVAR